MTRRRVKTGHLQNSRKISGERTHSGKFMTGVTRKKPGDLTCMDDVQLYTQGTCI
jgi:hypothetical protein